MLEETVKYPPIPAASLSPALTPADFAKGQTTVTMVFERPVLFTAQFGVRVRYPKGVHEVPKQYADHWYFKANEARVYNKPVAVSEAPAPKATAKPAQK